MRRRNNGFVQNRHDIPGTLVRVVDEVRLFEDQPQSALLLSWHGAEELVAKLAEWGFNGSYIVPLPEPCIVGRVVHAGQSMTVWPRMSAASVLRASGGPDDVMQSDSAFRSRRTLAIVSYALAASILAVCAWPIFAFSMKHYLPLIDNDEVIYFLEIKAFLTHGFNGGNFFINDQVPASRIHSGLHGPAFTAIYGVFARAIGWQNYSPYGINLLIFSASWLLLILSLRAQPQKRIAVAVFVLLHGYFFLFLPSLMQESFHISAAISMAALWKIALDRKSAAAWTGLFVVTLIAMLTRYTWGLTLPMFVHSFLQQRFPGTSTTLLTRLAVLSLSIFVGGTLTYLAAKLWVYWTEPAFVMAQAMSTKPLPEALNNLRALFSFQSINVFGKHPLYFRVSTWVLLVSFASAVLFARSASSRDAATYSLLLMALPMVVHSLFYIVDGYRDFRILASFHALAGLTFLTRADLRSVGAHPRIRLLATAAVIMLVGVNLQLTVEGGRSRYQVDWQRTKGSDVDRSAMLLFATMANHMHVAPEDTSFCKTLYGPINMTADPRIIHLPLGFAFSAVLPVQPDRLPPLKGKYALLYNAPSPFNDLVDASHDWRLIGSFERYRLYQSTVHCLDTRR